ncbi:MAG: AMP-binding protein, partial [Myxococcota bacterium]
MYPGVHATETPDKLAYRIAESGASVTYRELEERSNRAAHLFRSLGLKRGDHIALCMENHEEFFIVCWGAQRAGLYYTAISSRLTAPEVEYIVDDCGAKALVVSRGRYDVAAELQDRCPALVGRFGVDGAAPGVDDWSAACGKQPATPIADESEGAPMLYSSGTTGRPKGVMYTHRGAAINALGEIVVHKLERDSVFLWTLPLFHCNGWCFPWAVTAAG